MTNIFYDLKEKRGIHRGLLDDGFCNRNRLNHGNLVFQRRRRDQRRLIEAWRGLREIEVFLREIRDLRMIKVLVEEVEDSLVGRV